MGIIKAAAGAVGGTAGDNWKEFFSCDSLENDILMQRGKRVTGERSSNNGSDEVITNGSIVALADGQNAILVSGGKVVEVFTEPGENEVTTGSPTLFEKNGLGKLGKEAVKRFGYGGDIPVVSQRIYYFNTKEIVNNTFTTIAPIPFKITDENIGADIDCSLVCSGVFSFKIVNPVVTYKKLIGNVTDCYDKSVLLKHINHELLSVLQTAAGNMESDCVRPYQLPQYLERFETEVKKAFNDHLEGTRGLNIVSIAFSEFSLTSEDASMISILQKYAVLRDPAMAAATLVGAQADAIVTAAENGGAASMVGLAFAQNTINNTSTKTVEDKPKLWVCKCGAMNTSKFCTNCGSECKK